ncbi:MAG: hypothetical protein IJU76_02635 [Desulfovibrionaceae bacterium]|nr:hypothetical protein [Desulfovibrionaceae bacterium]
MNSDFCLNSENEWTNTKHIFDEKPVYIHLSDLNTTHSGRLKIVVNDVGFDSCFLKKNTEKLIVFISGPGRKDYDNPAFWRKSYSSYFEDSCLYIDDPCNIEKRYAPTFFWGDSLNNYADLFLDIVIKFKEIYKIENKNIALMGCSNTGFVALYCSSLLDGSLCLSFNPQFNIRLYLDDNKLQSKFNMLFSCDFNNSIFDDRVDVCDKIIKNKTSKFFITSNIACFFDKSQIDLFSKKASRKFHIGLNFFDNKFVYISNFYFKNPHLFLPDESYCRFIYDFLHRDSLCVDDYYMFNALNKSLYWYFYERDRADRFWGSILFLKNIINSITYKAQCLNFNINKLKKIIVNKSNKIKSLTDEFSVNSNFIASIDDKIKDKNLIISDLNSEIRTLYIKIDKLNLDNHILKDNIFSYKNKLKNRKQRKRSCLSKLFNFILNFYKYIGLHR